MSLSTNFENAETKASELQKALRAAGSGRGSWEAQNPHIPFDLTEEEAVRGSVVNGRFQLHPEDVARRSGLGKAA